MPPSLSSTPDAPVDGAVQSSPSVRWSQSHGWTHLEDKLAAEAPLAIEIAYTRGGQPVCKTLAITMRTPGHDEELALGFLLAEGLIQHRTDVVSFSAHDKNTRGETISTQRVTLARPPREDLQRLSRGVITSSACGLCGRRSLEGLPLQNASATAARFTVSPDVIERLPDTLREHQPLFLETGGSHGAALCDALGEPLLTREDVGRHNAVDKLIGAALRHDIAFDRAVLVLSGRASFELVQKASAAGIPLIVAVGAPSSLAASLAHTAGLTLVGFTRPGRFNIYTHAPRIAFNSPAPTPTQNSKP